MNVLRKIFGKDHLDEKNLEELKLKNKELELKLSEKQKQINKTNAYYKRKIHNMMLKKSA
jgi:hypothetical protein